MGRFKAVTTSLRKKFPLILVCAGITGFSLFTLVSHYRAPAEHIDLLTKVENWLLDYRFVARGPVKESGKIGILAIDEESLQFFNRWPLNREVYEPAIRNLKEAGVEWIGMDVVWAEPQEPYLKDVARHIDAIRNAKAADLPQVLEAELGAIAQAQVAGQGDLSLARMVANHPELVLGYFYYKDPWEAEALGEDKWKGLDIMTVSEVPEDFILKADRTLESYKGITTPLGIVANMDLIAENAEHFGFFSNETDDSVSRWNVALRNVNGHLMPSLSFKMAMNMLQAMPIVEMDTQGISKVDLISMETEEVMATIPMDDKGTGKILINHLGRIQTIPHISLKRAYQGDFTEAELKMLKGRSLLLGPTAVSINDQRPNPFDPAMMGVENHAATIDNIVSGRYMSRSLKTRETEMMIVLVIGLLFGPIMIWGKATLSGVAAVLFLTGYYWYDKTFWFGQGQWVYMAMPFFEITSLFVSTTLYKYAIEEREKRKLKGQFGAYVDPELIKQMEDDPNAGKVGGRKEDLTVFFSDVRGFTSISENLAPEKLVELMNEYFEPMTAIIKGSNTERFGQLAINRVQMGPAKLSHHGQRIAVL